MYSTIRLVFASLCWLGLTISFGTAQNADRYVSLIIDASGSMNADLSSGTSKIEAAKRALGDMVGDLDGDVHISLRAYGHQSPRSAHNCKDTALLVPFGKASANAAKVKSEANGLRAQGYTPITYVLGLAAEDMKALEGKRTIVLVSDGKETCEGDPCALARKLSEADIELTIHTVGFGVDASTRKQLQCIAEAGRGNYFDANSQIELTDTITKAAEAETEEVEEVVVTVRVGKLVIEGGGTHRIFNSETGEQVETYNRVQYSAKKPMILPPGRYDVTFGKAKWGVTLKGGETTVLSPARLVIEGGDLHRIYESESGEEVDVYHRPQHSAKKPLPLPSGRYEVGFGKARWSVTLKEGETTTLSPGLLVINGGNLHRIYDSESGEEVDVYHRSQHSAKKPLPLPPGRYEVGFGKARWGVTVKEGEVTTMRPGLLVIEGGNFHRVRDAETGEDVDSYNRGQHSDRKPLPLPPGRYELDLSGQKLPIEISEGKKLVVRTR